MEVLQVFDYQANYNGHCTVSERSIQKNSKKNLDCEILHRNIAINGTDKN